MGNKIIRLGLDAQQQADIEDKLQELNREVSRRTQQLIEVQLAAIKDVLGLSIEELAARYCIRFDQATNLTAIVLQQPIDGKAVGTQVGCGVLPVMTPNGVRLDLVWAEPEPDTKQEVGS